MDSRFDGVESKQDVWSCKTAFLLYGSKTWFCIFHVSMQVMLQTEVKRPSV